MGGILKNLGIKTITTVAFFFLFLYWLHFILPAKTSFVHSFFNRFVFGLRFVTILLLGYINYYYFLPQFLDKKKYIVYFLSIIAVSIAFIFVPLFLKVAPPGDLISFNLEGPDYIVHFLPRHTLFNPLMTLFMYLAAVWISFFVYTVRNKELSEKQQLGQEVDFLKNQINPHFVFNSLNNIYSLAISKSEKTPESILKLSDILRYVFYETNREKIPLETEVNYLQSYISFQQYRLPSGVKVNFEQSGNFEQADIVPMILINYVENAFKYGVSTFTNAIIDIRVDFHNDWLTLKTVNDIFAVAGNKSNKIGGENTLRRLEYHYPGRYFHEIREEDGRYYSELKVKLQ